jgi:proline iminopeptidase
MKILLLSISILTLFASCKMEELYTQGDYFFLRNKGADMPVWVRGNIASSVFVIHLHGGPGGSSITEAQEKAFLSLETDHAMVYWDQRASGASQGNAKPATMNMEQFVDDLQQLVVFIKHKYNNPKLFLLGHSWGAALGTAYLTSNDFQNNFRGWIEMDGAHNFKQGLELSRKWAIDYANNAIAQDKDKIYWQDALAWYNLNPVLNTKKLLDIHSNDYLVKANGYIFDPKNVNLSAFTGGNPTSPAGTTTSGDYAQQELEEELSKGYSALMPKITIPSLILWGKNDGIMPVAMAQDAYNNLGTETAKKSIVLFENAAHSPNREDPNLFNSSVKAFIELYK